VSLTDEQLDRYARHIVLKEIGGEGQRKLLAAHAAIVGAGGIGSPVIQYLAAAGVGRLTIIDDDTVSLSNLQRQTLFATRDIGHRKADKAADFVRAINPDVGLTIAVERLDAGNAARLLDGADIVVDGSDNFETRLAVADASTRLHIPLVSAAIGEFEGQLGVYRGWEEGKPCYRCLVGSDPARPEQSCSEQGVLGAMAGVMGSLAAMEAVRILTGFGEDSAGTLLRVDALRLQFRKVSFPKDPGCPSCAG
jgi:molybdopterin/thiamine biosynthesis adenylyltransferase